MNNYIKLLMLFVVAAISINTFANEVDREHSNQSAIESATQNAAQSETGANTSSVSRGNYPQIYSNSLHDEMSIAARYQEGGAYYLRGETNSFGENEAINTQQEVIFCVGGDKTFTEVAKESLSSVLILDHTGAVIKDSASTGALPNQFISALEAGLANNANSNAKGRFCYKVTNPDVDYRTAGSETANYCGRGTSTGIFEDPVTGNRCELILDIDLKAGETRYLRQPAGDYRTISQGFVSCSNDGLKTPHLSLVENPDSCGPGGAGICSYSCIWADETACSGSLMPRWGGGSCGGIGSTIFLNDAINIESSKALSFNVISGIQYEGSAQMSCQTVGESAAWVITGSNCSEVED